MARQGKGSTNKVVSPTRSRLLLQAFTSSEIQTCGGSSLAAPDSPLAAVALQRTVRLAFGSCIAEFDGFSTWASLSPSLTGGRVSVASKMRGCGSGGIRGTQVGQESGQFY